MLELFAFAFMQRALLAGAMVAVICPAIGLFLVLRRMGQFGDALAHVSLAGVAAGMLMQAYPVAIGLAFSVAAALGMDWFRQSYKRYGELSVAIMLSASMGLAVVLLSIAADRGAGAGGVLSYLFGSLMTVTALDLYVIGGLGLLVLLTLLLLYKELLAITFDEEHARVSGLPVGLVNTIYMVLTAAVVAMAMRVVGVLVVSGLVVVPVATALQVARSFRGAFAISVGAGLLAMLVGLVVSSALNLAPGGVVVLTAVAILLVVAGYKRIRGLA
ncbi:MAG TPA: metal ABC transporter permease [Symbiobacteriaceae bacterium]|jgi:zinc transport system permease protein